MNLYRIKPLEWEHFAGHTFNAGDYRVRQGETGSWLWRYKDPFNVAYDTGLASSIEEAKAACESHRRKLMEAELEPSHQLSTALPTEPGCYWWRNPTYPIWLVVMVSRAHVFFGGRHFSREEWGEVYDPGQWIRIPEPEGEE